jgi:Tol biopolymer transport system component
MNRPATPTRFFVRLVVLLMLCMSAAVCLSVLIGQAVPDPLVVYSSFREPPPSSGSSLYLLDTTSGLSWRYRNPEIHSPCCPAWSADGQWIAFVDDVADQRGKIHVMRTDGRDLHVILMEDNRSYINPAWSPVSHEVAFVPIEGEMIYLANVDTKSVYPVANHSSVKLNIPYGTLLSWSADGKAILFDNQNAGQNLFTLYWISLDDGSIHKAASVDETVHQAAFSPNTMKIVYGSGKWLQREICVVGADDTNAHCISQRFVNSYNPAWSPDGSRIAFVSDQDSTRIIYVADENGANLVRVKQTTLLIENLAWSPDGQRLLYETWDGISEGELYTINIDGTGERRLTLNDYQEMDYAWQPVK